MARHERRVRRGAEVPPGDGSAITPDRTWRDRGRRHLLVVAPILGGLLHLVASVISVAGH